MYRAGLLSSHYFIKWKEHLSKHSTSYMCSAIVHTKSSTACALGSVLATLGGPRATSCSFTAMTKFLWAELQIVAGFDKPNTPRDCSFWEQLHILHSTEQYRSKKNILAFGQCSLIHAFSKLITQQGTIRWVSIPYYQLPTSVWT